MSATLLSPGITTCEAAGSMRSNIPEREGSVTDISVLQGFFRKIVSRMQFPLSTGSKTIVLLESTNVAAELTARTGMNNVESHSPCSMCTINVSRSSPLVSVQMLSFTTNESFVFTTNDGGS